MATIATLRAADGLTLTAVNTHFDDQGAVARLESAKLLVSHLQPRIRSGGLVILTGDLNSHRNEAPYQAITGHRYTDEASTPGQHVFDSQTITFLDTRRLVLRPYGENQTFTGFAGEKHPGIIDCACAAC